MNEEPEWLQKLLSQRKLDKEPDWLRNESAFRQHRHNCRREPGQIHRRFISLQHALTETSIPDVGPPRKRGQQRQYADAIVKGLAWRGIFVGPYKKAETSHMEQENGMIDDGGNDAHDDIRSDWSESRSTSREQASPINNDLNGHENDDAAASLTCDTDGLLDGIASSAPADCCSKYSIQAANADPNIVQATLHHGGSPKQLYSSSDLDNPLGTIINRPALPPPSKKLQSTRRKNYSPLPMFQSDIPPPPTSVQVVDTLDSMKQQMFPVWPVAQGNVTTRLTYQVDEEFKCHEFLFIDHRKVGTLPVREQHTSFATRGQYVCQFWQKYFIFC